METKQSTVEKLFMKYRHLAKVYANKVFDYQKLGLEKKDIVQDLEIKIFTTIESYAQKLIDHKKAPTEVVRLKSLYDKAKKHKFPFEKLKEINNAYNDARSALNKPIPLKFYIKLAMVNMVKDFIKYINRENGKTSISEINYDFGVATNTTIDFKAKNIVINDIDILEGLDKRERQVFLLHLKGFGVRKMNKIYRDDEFVQSVIEKQTKKLTSVKNDLYEQKAEYSVFNLNED